MGRFVNGLGYFDAGGEVKEDVDGPPEQNYNNKNVSDDYPAEFVGPPEQSTMNYLLSLPASMIPDKYKAADGSIDYGKLADAGTVGIQWLGSMRAAGQAAGLIPMNSTRSQAQDTLDIANAGLAKAQADELPKKSQLDLEKFGAEGADELTKFANNKANMQWYMGLKDPFSGKALNLMDQGVYDQWALDNDPSLNYYKQTMTQGQETLPELPPTDTAPTGGLPTPGIDPNSVIGTLQAGDAPAFGGALTQYVDFDGSNTAPPRAAVTPAQDFLANPAGWTADPVDGGQRMDTSGYIAQVNSPDYWASQGYLGDPADGAQRVSGWVSPPDQQTVGAAKGGQIKGGLGQASEAKFFRGGSKGQADKIPAMLSDGEFVFDADTVAALGDGNTEAGASALELMRRNIRKHKRSAPVDKIPPKAKKPEAYLSKKGK